LLLLGPIPNSIARPGGPTTSRAIKALDHSPDKSAGYGTGTVIHADALRAGENALVDVDVAFSGAAFSQEAVAKPIVNEVHRKVTDKLLADGGFGRGTGLELGLASEPIPLIGQLSKAAAPPSSQLVHNVLGPIGIPNIATLELLRSQAQALGRNDGCVLGRNAGYGLGSVLDLELLGGLISTVARPPRREVSQSTSTTRIIAGSTPGRLALKSEVRQTIAPVTLFKGTPIQFTVEVLGEWALRAVADGAKGSIHYGPLEENPETPVLRVLNAKGEVLGQLTTQQLLSDDGLEIVIPGVAEIVLGEDPRAIGGDASSKPKVTGSSVAGAVDVVRIKLIGGTLADVRVGHMETAVDVPADTGVRCPGLVVDQTVDPENVTPGNEFDYTITITNPHDCVLEDTKLVQKITAPAGVTYTLVDTDPDGGVLAGDTITFENLGPIQPGKTKTVKVTLKVAGEGEGLMISNAVVTGVCPEEDLPETDLNGPNVPSDPTGDIPVRGEDTLEGPTVGVCDVANLAGKSPTEAKALLEAAGCVLGEVKEAPPNAQENDTYDTGKVVDQSIPPGSKVPLGTPVDITVNGPLCTVPSLSGLTPDAADKVLEAAGCDLGDVNVGPPGGPGDPGTITTQNPPAGDKVPAQTDVDVTINPPTCVVPDVKGLTQAEAEAKLKAAGCDLGDVKPGADDPNQAGKITEQSVPSGQSVPKGTEVDITVAGPVGTDLGTQVLGENLNKAADAGGGAGAAPALARTGGVALAGLALWLLVSGLLSGGTAQAWKVLRRRMG
jgi:beta-lactam-binding protein with PASTA domain